MKLTEQYFDELVPDDQRLTLLAFKELATPATLQALERIASNPAYEIPFPGATPNTSKTLREVAIDWLSWLGVSSMADSVLDRLNDRTFGFIEYRLAKMEREPAMKALQRRLHQADESTLPRLLELLGYFGDESVLADIQNYITDPRTGIAKAAYEAEQQILGLADL